MKILLSRVTLLACAALALALPASAQNVVYAEGFESGLTGWIGTGLWNSEDAADSCGSLVAPFPEGTKCAWYGSSVNCNFDVGTTSGTLTQTAWVQLPDAPSISLHFWTYIQSEYCWTDNNYYTSYDVCNVTITRESGGAISQQQCASGTPAVSTLPWHERQIDISTYRNARIKVTFTFNSVDGLSNAYLGMLIDNIRILAEPAERVCGPAGLTSGCPCMPVAVPVAGGCRNSTLQSCTLFSEGTPSVSADTILLRAEHMPPVASAILTQSNGTGPAVAFVDGLRCISGGLLRMGAVVASGGIGTWPLPGESISVRGMIPAIGATKYYYVYYRDVMPYCTPATANLSDTRKITWLP